MARPGLARPGPARLGLARPSTQTILEKKDGCMRPSVRSGIPGQARQGWQGRSGSLTSAPQPATPGEISAPRPATPRDPAQVTTRTPGSLRGRAAALARPDRLGHHKGRLSG